MRSGGDRHAPPATTHPESPWMAVALLINSGKLWSIQAKDVMNRAQGKEQER
jgi:hypothetical protein